MTPRACRGQPGMVDEAKPAHHAHTSSGLPSPFQEAKERAIASSLRHPKLAFPRSGESFVSSKNVCHALSDSWRDTHTRRAAWIR
eukprot:363511-Chlamydomonas_euryale.AAC.5